jgi:hypothetical protein
VAEILVKYQFKKKNPIPIFEINISDIQSSKRGNIYSYYGGLWDC